MTGNRVTVPPLAISRGLDIDMSILYRLQYLVGLGFRIQETISSNVLK